MKLVGSTYLRSSSVLQIRRPLQVSEEGGLVVSNSTAAALRQSHAPASGVAVVGDHQRGVIA